MKLGIAPEVVLAAYRVGNSPPNGVSPLMPYFALIVVFAQRYQKEAGIGTVVAMMLPYAVAISVVWILLFSGLGNARPALRSGLTLGPAAWARQVNSSRGPFHLRNRSIATRADYASAALTAVHGETGRL